MSAASRKNQLTKCSPAFKCSALFKKYFSAVLKNLKRIFVFFFFLIGTIPEPSEPHQSHPDDFSDGPAMVPMALEWFQHGFVVVQVSAVSGV